MALPYYKLDCWQDQGIVIESPFNPRPRIIPPLVIGTQLLVSLSVYSGVQANLLQVDLSTLSVTLSVETVAPIPILGQIAFTFGGASASVDYSATGADIQAALAPMLGQGVKVTLKGGGWFFIESGLIGDHGALTATFATDPNVSISITEVSDGATPIVSAWRVIVSRTAPAQILPNSWTVNGQSLTGTLDMRNIVWNDTVDDKAMMTIVLDDGTNSIPISIPVAIRGGGNASDEGLIALENQGGGYILLE